MNLFRSEEHLHRWQAWFHEAGDYVMTVGEWAEVFSSPMFRRRLDPDYLARSPRYLEDYRAALRSHGKALPPPDRVLSAVMFTDIVGSTTEAAAVGDDVWGRLLERHNQVVRDQLDHFGGREVKQTGDGFLSAFDSPARAIRCAVAIRQQLGEVGLRIRAGVHCGECEVLGDDLGGIAVHLAARITATAGADEILVSRTVKDAVAGSGLEFESRGSHELRGVPGVWDLYAPLSSAW